MILWLIFKKCATNSVNVLKKGVNRRALYRVFFYILLYVYIIIIFTYIFTHFLHIIICIYNNNNKWFDTPPRQGVYVLHQGGDHLKVI